MDNKTERIYLKGDIVALKRGKIRDYVKIFRDYSREQLLKSRGVVTKEASIVHGLVYVNWGKGDLTGFWSPDDIVYDKAENNIRKAENNIDKTVVLVLV